MVQDHINVYLINCDTNLNNNDKKFLKKWLYMLYIIYELFVFPLGSPIGIFFVVKKDA